MRWQDQKEEDMLEDALERFLEDLTARYGDTALRRPTRRAAAQTPAMAVEDNGVSYVVLAELPGVTPEDLKVVASGASITLEGKWAHAPSCGEVFLKETRSGPFRRVLNLPGPFRGDLAQAVLENGLLEIELPKADELLNAAYAIDLT